MGRQEREEVEGYENGAARRSKRGKGGGGAVVGIAGIVLLGLAGKLVSRYVNLRKQESVCEKAGVKVVEDGVDQLLPAAALPELNGEEEDAAHTLPLPNLNGDACATVNGSKEWENGQQVEEEVVPAQGGLDGGEVEKEVEEEADVEEMRVELPQPEACRSSLVEVECTGSGSDEENPPSPSLMDSVDKPEVHHTSPIRMPVKDVTPAALQALQPVSPRKPPRSPSPSPSPSRLNSGKFADRLAAASIIADPDLILSHLLHPKIAPPPPPPLLPETEESYPPSLPKDLEGLPLSAQLKSVTWQHGTSVEEKHVAATAKQVVTSTHILEDKGVTEPIEEETFLDAGEVGMMKEAEASTDLKPPHHVHSADTCEDIWSSLGRGVPLLLLLAFFLLLLSYLLPLLHSQVWPDI